MLKKKRFLAAALLIIATLLFSLTVSARTQEFSGNVKSGESIDIDEFTFIITLNKYANAIFVDAGTMFQTVPIFTSRKMEWFDINFSNVTYDEEENELYAIVAIYRYVPDVSITRTINQTELYVGNEAEATITILNSGDTAPQIIMTDDYPASVEIFDMEGGCSVHENQVYWKGHLDKGKSKECIFMIRPTEQLEKRLVAHLQYWDGFKWIDEYSSSLTIKVEPIISIESDIVEEDYEVAGRTFTFDDENPGIVIGETLMLLANITNNYDDEIEVDSFIITLPPDLQYSSLGHLRFNYQNASGNRSSIVWYSDSIKRSGSDKLKWADTLNSRQSKLFVLKILAKSTGVLNIIMNTDYSYDDMNFYDMQHRSIEVSDPGVAIRMSVSDKSKRFSAPERLDEDDDALDLEALHPYRVTIYAQNTNPYSQINNVNIKVSTGLAEFKNVYYNVIEEEGQKIPYSFVMIPPAVEKSTVFKMNITASYKNAFGESHSNTTEFQITVKPFNDLTITSTSSEGTTLESGDETEVTVSVTNDRLIEIKDVRVADTIPSAIDVEGVHSKNVKLNPGEETEVYTYRLKAPRVNNRTRYDIITNVSFFDPDSRNIFAFSKKTTLLIEPLKPAISVDATLDSPSDVYPGVLIPLECTVENSEEKEIVRDITISFPIQPEFDFIGPKTFFIDKLDPGESSTLSSIARIRPKVAGTLNFGEIVVDYYDAYQNLFNENSTEQTVTVENGKMNGPAIFITTIVPGFVNISSQAKIKLLVKNNGTSEADLMVEQEENAWNISVDAGSQETIEYTLRYDFAGNYTIPPPVARFTFQGLDAYTGGSGAELRVKLLSALPEASEEAQVQEAVVQAAAQTKEAAQSEKEEISFEEYQLLMKSKVKTNAFRYFIIFIIAVVAVIFLVIYINYRKGSGDSLPFLEPEK